MYSRVTLLEIDTVRIERRRGRRACSRSRCCRPCASRRATRACYVLATPEGKGMIVTFWETEEAARRQRQRLLPAAGREASRSSSSGRRPDASATRSSSPTRRRRPVERSADERALRHPGRHACSSSWRSRSALRSRVARRRSRSATAILLKLGVRNVGRRRGPQRADRRRARCSGRRSSPPRSTTGDTMSHTIRSTAVDALGETDETIAAKGAADDIPGALGAATGTGWFDESDGRRGSTSALARHRARRTASPARSSSRSRCRLRRSGRASRASSLFAADPARMDGLLADPRERRRHRLARRPRPGEVFLNRKAADELGVAAGDRVARLRGRRPAPRARARRRAASTARAPRTPPCSLPLADGAAAVRAAGQGQARPRLEPRRRDVAAPRSRTRSSSALQPVVGQLGLEVQTRQAGRDRGRRRSRAPRSWRSSRPSARSRSRPGILLIFLIFVMLAAERRGELGIARAIGTRRGHLVEMFTFEGAAYDLAAAAVGALLGAAVALGMVIVMASAFGAADADEGLQIEFAVSARSLVIAVRARRPPHARRRRRLGVAGERDEHLDRDPQPAGAPASRRRRRRLVLAALGLVLGLAARRLGNALGRHGDAADARRLARAHGPRAAAARSLGVPERLAVHGVRAGASSCCPDAAVEPVGRRLRDSSRWTSRPGSSPA